MVSSMIANTTAIASHTHGQKSRSIPRSSTFPTYRNARPPAVGPAISRSPPAPMNVCVAEMLGRPNKLVTQTMGGGGERVGRVARSGAGVGATDAERLVGGGLVAAGLEIEA